MKTAIFSPGPSYRDAHVRRYAGWAGILDLYRETLQELGYRVFIPDVPPELIDERTTVSRMLSYDVLAAAQIPKADLFLGPPGYSLGQMMTLGTGTEKFTYVWNNSDEWRDSQLAAEYAYNKVAYDLSPVWREVNRQALIKCDHVIACSPWVKKTHASIVPASKIHIAFWGVDSKMFTPPEVEPPGFRILYVGGDPIRKGLVYLLEALGHHELWIVGCNITTDLPNVRSFGLVRHEEMPGFYRQCHVLCVPTLEDGIACCIQEGMASGLVPITSPETSEVFDAGVSGIKVGYRDIEGIRGAIARLHENPDKRRAMARMARLKAEDQTWAKTKQELKVILRGAECAN